jgi:hypothetical protein
MKALYLTMCIIVVLAAAWWVVRPGVFTVQPIGALPEGITVIYHSRNTARIPIFASGDGLCLTRQGSVSLLCRAVMNSSMLPITEHILWRLPYSHTAYLISTGWQEFER